MDYLISVPVSTNLAAFIGKKGSEDSLIFYNRKLNDDVIVALAPSNTEEKFYYGTAEAMLLSNQIIISTESVNKQLGEVIVAASLLDKPILITDENDIKTFLAGNILKKFEFSSKEELLEKIVKNKPEPRKSETRIDLDHGFNVKGVGVVVLGIVVSGTVKVHDALFHSSGKQISVRSIQSQDVDVTQAGVNTRVGLSLKGIEAEDISKGDILYTKAVTPTKKITVKIKNSPLAKEQIEESKRYTFVSNFSYAIAKVDQVGDSTILSLERPLALLEGDQFLLIRENSPRIFASGVIEKTT